MARSGLVVVPMAAGGMGPRAFTASCSFALVSFARASGEARASDRAAGCPWGAPWGRGARVEVRQAECAKIKTSLIVDQKKIFSQKRKFQKKVTFTSRRALLSARFRSQIKNPYKIGFMASVLDDL